MALGVRASADPAEFILAEQASHMVATLHSLDFGFASWASLDVNFLELLVRKLLARLPGVGRIPTVCTDLSLAQRTAQYTLLIRTVEMHPEPHNALAVRFRAEPYRDIAFLLAFDFKPLKPF
jgi:hypothetical protein